MVNLDGGIEGRGNREYVERAQSLCKWLGEKEVKDKFSSVPCSVLLAHVRFPKHPIALHVVQRKQEGGDGARVVDMDMTRKSGSHSRWGSGDQIFRGMLAEFVQGREILYIVVSYYQRCNTVKS